MRIAFLATDDDRRFSSPEERLAQSLPQRELPLELSARGHRVASFFLSPETARFRHEHVPYVFLCGSSPGRPIRRLVSRVLLRKPTEFESLAHLLEEMTEFKPEAIHLHNVASPFHLRTLRHRFGNLPFLVRQRDGSRTRRSSWHCIQSLKSRALLVDSTTSAESVRAEGILGDEFEIVVLPETASIYEAHDTFLARAETGLTGHPLCLSFVLPEEDSDLQTVVNGFGIIQHERPRAHLCLCSSVEEMPEQLRESLDARPELAVAITWLGQCSAHELEWIYGSTDFVLQCRAGDPGTQSALDGMASGAIPILGDVLIFQEMRGDDDIGALFARSDPESLAEAVLSIDPASYERHSRRVRRRYESELSFPAQAAKLERLYREQLEQEEVRGHP